MPVTVHIADVTAADAARLLARSPRPGSLPGLLHADVALAKPLSGAADGSAPQPRRIGLLGFWREDADIEALADHPVGQALAGGWRARLEPTRVFGSWPGLAEDVPRNRNVAGRGPAVVLTLGRLRLPQAVRFLRTSAAAERRAVAAPGFTWGTALVRPPFVATCSLWRSAADLTDYAYGSASEPHPEAIAADRAKPFHHRSAFVRLAPYRLEGELAGRNALPGSAARA